MIGIDLVKISRIKNLIEKFGEKGLKRFLSQSEIAICKNNIQRIAGFWATKEAISKALKVGIGRDFSFHDVEIMKAENGRPIPKFSKKIIDKLLLAVIAHPIFLFYFQFCNTANMSYQANQV